MSDISVENVTVKTLADLLIDDIRRRGLRPGARYLTAAQAGQQFGVNEISVHRAMQLLANRDYLVRQRGSGTFIGSAFKSSEVQTNPLQVIHVVMSIDHQRTATVPAEVLVTRLGAALPESVVDVHYVTPFDAMRHLDRIMKGIDGAEKSSEGIILIRSSRKMQIYVEHSGVPAVVCGGVYPGVTQLPWVDVDQIKVGQSMAQYVLDNKSQKLLLLMRDDWRHGDNLMLEGIFQVLGKANFDMSALKILSIPPDPFHIEEELLELFSTDKSITGVMCRTHTYAEATTRAIKAAKGRSLSTMRIIAGGGRKPASIRHAYVTPQISEEEQIELIGQMLLERANHPDRKNISSRVISVEMTEPSVTNKDK